MRTLSKKQHYAQALEAVETKLVDALPDIFDALINRAKEGDTKAAAYICDRILGKVAASHGVPVEDDRPP